MTQLATTVFCALSLAAGVTMAASHSEMKKPEAAPAAMTMQQCKDHMAMAKKDGMKKDDAMMKKDTMCADMMKKEEAMKKDAMAPKK